MLPYERLIQVLVFVLHIIRTLNPHNAYDTQMMCSLVPWNPLILPKKGHINLTFLTTNKTLSTLLMSVWSILTLCNVIEVRFVSLNGFSLTWPAHRQKCYQFFFYKIVQQIYIMYEDVHLLNISCRCWFQVAYNLKLQTQQLLHTVCKRCPLQCVGILLLL